MRLDVELVTPSRKRWKVLPKPATIEEMATHYVHVADVRTEPIKVENPEQDLAGIITLKVGFEEDVLCGLTDQLLKNNGYYAYGTRNKEEVVFEVYIGHKSITEPFPSKRFEDAIAKFMFRLVKYGYHVTELNYKIPTNN